MIFELAIAQNESMNQYPSNNSDPQVPNNLGNVSSTQPPTDREVDPTTKPSKRVKKAKKSLISLILILMAIGVTLGTVLAISTVTIFNQFNLFDSPARVDEVAE
ncbi:MAG TPA: hypothetical protein V6D28_25030 [Leptolyngbyaceae cyanobacterium]